MTKAFPALAIDRFPLPVLALDVKGRVSAANAVAARCFVCAVPELVGTEFAAWATDPAALRLFLAERSVALCEFGFHAADGSERRLVLSLARDLVGMIDVTETRAAEEHFLDDISRFHDMLGASTGWFYEIDASMTKGRFFRRIERDGKVAVSEYSYKWEDAVDPTFNTLGIAETKRKYEAREPVRDFLYRVLPSAAYPEVYCLGSSVPFYDRKGVYQGRRGVSINVTKQVLAERALRESETRLRRSEEHLTQAQRIARIGSTEYHLESGREEWSEEMYRLVAADPATLAEEEKHLLAFAHPEDAERVRQAIAMARGGKCPSAGEIRILRRDGEIRTIYIENGLERDESGRPSVLRGVLKDVTEERAAEEQRKQMEQQLLQAQKLEALGTLAGGVAHELNNTLVPVLALAKMTVKRLPDGSREQNNLITILHAAEKARDLVERIVAFSRKEMPTRVMIDLAGLARTAIELLRASMPQTIRIEERIEPVPPMLGDPAQLPQIIINLVINAVQATRDQTGTVTVEVAPAPGERLPQSPDRAAGSAVRLSVIDRGIGIDGATRARIFEPFFTTKPVGEGTGLGLSVVHGIVTQHGGHIAVESAVGHGTRFDVYFPAQVVAASDKTDLRKRVAS